MPPTPPSQVPPMQIPPMNSTPSTPNAPRPVTVSGTLYDPQTPANGTRAERIAALKEQAAAFRPQIAGPLDAMQAAGLITDWSITWINGALNVGTTEDRAAAVIDALHAVDALRNVEFNVAGQINAEDSPNGRGWGDGIS